MTQKQFIALAVVCNIIFLFAYIYKQSLIIQATYTQQKSEQLLTTLHQEEKDLFNQLQAYQSHESIQKRAKNNLGMNKAKLKNMHRLSTTTASASAGAHK